MCVMAWGMERDMPKWAEGGDANAHSDTCASSFVVRLGDPDMQWGEMIEGGGGRDMLGCEWRLRLCA